MLSLSGTAGVLWSASGLEGTRERPAITVTPGDGGWAAPLRTRLAEVATRRRQAGTPPEPSIVIAIGDQLQVAELIAAMLAVRHDDAGQPLFPDVRFGVDFPPAVAEHPPDPDRVARDRAALEAEAGKYIASMIGDDSGGSGLTSDMARRSPDLDLDSTVRDLGEPGASLHDPPADRRGTGEPGPGQGIGPATAERGPGDDHDGKPTGPAVGTVRSLEDTSLTADQIRRRIGTVYLPGIERCHKQALKSDPTLQGRVTLSFTIGEAGRVADARVAGVDDGLDACIAALMRGWRFSPPRDDDGEPTEAPFRLVLDLRD